MKIFTAFALVGILLAFFAHPILISIYFGKRKNLKIEELLAIFDNAGEGRKEIIQNALFLISEAYRIPVGKLRPEDLLDGPISTIDSWRLGQGGEKISAYFEKNSPATTCLQNRASLSDLVTLLVTVENLRSIKSGNAD